MNRKSQCEKIQKFLNVLENNRGLNVWREELEKTSKTWNLFFCGAICGDSIFVEEELDDDESLVFQRERVLGLTALHVAVIGNSKGVVRMLLDYGACVNAKDKYGNTPADLAVLGKNGEVLEILKSGGGRFSVRAEKGKESRRGQNGVQVETKFSGVHKAVKLGDVDAVEEELDDDEWLLGARTEKGWTPLHVAAWFNHAGIVRLLLDLGANRNAKTKDGFTAKQLAKKNNSQQVCQILGGKVKQEHNAHKQTSEKSNGNDSNKASEFGMEGDAVEFKASGVSAAENTKIIEFLESKGEEQTEADRTNIERLKELNPISQAWILAKSIAGMANNAGGKIFVGINNSGKIVGLERDFAAEGLDKLKGMERWDKYALRLRERIECMFKNRAVAGVLFKLTPKESEGKDYFVISIQKSSTPIFICKKPETRTWKKTATPDEFREFYLRLGGATKRVSYKDAEEYIKTRFPEYSE